MTSGKKEALFENVQPPNAYHQFFNLGCDMSPPLSHYWVTECEVLKGQLTAEQGNATTPVQRCSEATLQQPLLL